MNAPFFSILIPAKGRPQYLDEAIQSILLQEFQDVELVISNNGADFALREVAKKYLGDVRVRYVEQAQILNMPAHWEKVTQELEGEYILVLTDRSVLKVGALDYLYKQITGQDELPNVISWPWDLYYDHLKILVPFESFTNGMQTLKSDTQLIRFAKGNSEYLYSLPRGLNSCTRRTFINQMRVKHGSVFRTINPDFSFGYMCLMHTEKFNYIEQPLFVSQGLKVSNGGNSFGGDASPYFKSLELDELFKHVPIKFPMVQNGIHEDFLAMASLCGRDDLINAWDRKNYYLECLAEFDAKKTAGILKAEDINEIKNIIVKSLANESQDFQQVIKQSRTLKKAAQTRLIRIAKKMVGTKLETIRRFILLRKKKGIVCATALEAAGFEPAAVK